jgi:membrane associated rhomboid family serine protease
MATATCYRHPDRETGVACSRCGRPICPDCMTPTSVGMRCPECAGEKTQVRRPALGAVSGAARATMVLIAINVVAFLFEILGGSGNFSTDSRFYADGALCANAIGDGGICGGGGLLLRSDGGEVWRIVTAGFLHGGFFHVALNMFALYFLGRFLEPTIGTARFVAIYFLSLVAGSAGALLLSEAYEFTTGASGAIYGLFAATLIVARHRGQDQVVQQLTFILLFNLVYSFTAANISVGGHLGGLLGGALGALILIELSRRLPRDRRLPIELGAIGALTVAFFIGAVVIATAGISL